MEDRPLRRSGVLTFPGSPTDERMLCALLVTQDDAGNVHAFVRTGEGAQALSEETVAMFSTAVEIAQL